MKEEEKSIANIKVKETDLCIKCGKELKTQKMGSGDLFGFTSSGSGAFYCENTDCDMFGYLTLARTKKSEKVVELNEKEKTE